MSPHSPDPTERLPHPLAISLIERLSGRVGARVLEIGAGSGRNTRALEIAGFEVVSRGGPIADAALTTHALLHGTPETTARDLAAIAAQLAPGAPLHGTFGSIHDARYGEGERIEEHVYAPTEGDERGVAHVFYDEARLRSILESHFLLEDLVEIGVDTIAGTWAHKERPLEGAVHWFVKARRR